MQVKRKTEQKICSSDPDDDDSDGDDNSSQNDDNDAKCGDDQETIGNLWSVFARESHQETLDLTSSNGGFSPMGKLIVFKLITSWTDDIFVNGPYTDLPRERC